MNNYNEQPLLLTGALTAEELPEGRAIYDTNDKFNPNGKDLVNATSYLPNAIGAIASGADVWNTLKDKEIDPKIAAIASGGAIALGLTPLAFLNKLLPVKKLPAYAYFGGKKYTTGELRDKVLAKYAEEIGLKPNQIYDEAGKINPRLFVHPKLQDKLGVPNYDTEFGVAYTANPRGYEGKTLSDKYAGTGLDQVDDRAVPGELMGHNYLGLYGFKDTDGMLVNPREQWSYIADEVGEGAEGIFKIPAKKYFGRYDSLVKDQSPEVMNGIREFQIARGYKPNDLYHSMNNDTYGDIIQAVLNEAKGIGGNNINKYMANRYGILGDMEAYTPGMKDMTGPVYPQVSLGRPTDAQLVRQTPITDEYQIENKFLNARRYIKERKNRSNKPFLDITRRNK